EDLATANVVAREHADGLGQRPDPLRQLTRAPRRPIAALEPRLTEILMERLPSPSGPVEAVVPAIAEVAEAAFQQVLRRGPSYRPGGRFNPRKAWQQPGGADVHDRPPEATKRGRDLPVFDPRDRPMPVPPRQFMSPSLAAPVLGQAEGPRFVLA